MGWFPVWRLAVRAGDPVFGWLVDVGGFEAGEGGGEGGGRGDLDGLGFGLVRG